MKRLFLLLLCGVAATASLFAQAKKPKIMVVPSDLWCNTNGYMTEYDDQGTAVRVPDYVNALQSDPNLLPVISKINDLMHDRGFDLSNLESEIKSLSQQKAEMSLVQSKAGGEVTMGPIDQLRQRAKADIILQVTWTVNVQGPKRSVTYTLQGLDAYTNKQVAGSTGTGNPSFSAEIPVLLAEAVGAHMDAFCDRLQSHFDDLFENGREVSLSVQVFDTAPFDLETEYDGRELTEIVDEWMSENTVGHRYSLIDATENYMRFEQVRIPLFNEKGRPVDTNQFARELVKYLKGVPCNIGQIKVMPQGLGHVTLVLGDK